MTVFCIRHLRRLPAEVEVPLEELVQGMVAFGIAQERFEQELRG